MTRWPAKLILAQAHRDIGNEEDLIIIRRGSEGTQCYSTMDNKQTVELLGEMADTICLAQLVGKFNA